MVLEQEPTDSDSGLSETGQDCTGDEAPEVNWLAVGPHPVGWRTHATTSTLDGSALSRDYVVYYPALAEGEGQNAALSSGPFPTVFFEHAGGSHYLDYTTLFTHLASHGIVVVSIDHNGIDASGNWGDGEWWAGHDLLFLDTIEEVIGWSQSSEHSYSGLVDTGRLGLAGHSHGSALLTLQGLGPYDASAARTIRAVSLLAPCPDEEEEDYLTAYTGMPPLQVIYGSRDQDGCVAYGQSIAVFEAGARPSQFVHLVGGSHYGFTEEGSLLDATISREDHQAVAAAGLLAWWKYQLEDDLSALPVLRGDQDLVPFGPESRIQFLDAHPLVVDDFSSDETTTDSDWSWIDVPVITGVEGQTFVNGFLSDAFVDTAAGVALVRAEMEILLAAEPVADDPAEVLYFVDAVLGEDAYGLALDQLEATGAIRAVRLGSHSAFSAGISAGGWDLVISATQGGAATDENASDEALAAWICAGGKAIVSDYRMASSGAAAVLACSQTAYGGESNYTDLTSTGDLFDGTLDLFNPGWGFYAVDLQAEGATVFATAQVPSLVSTEDGVNDLGLAVEHTGLSVYRQRWMYDTQDTLYHPNWGLEFAWDAPGASLRQVVGNGAGLDLSDRPVLSFRLLQLHSDSRNPAGSTQDLHLRLTDADGRSGTILLSQAPQGALRPAAEVATGLQPKSVYETYRLPLSLFTENEPALDTGRVVSVEWILDVTETGALAMDDVAFTGAGVCE